MREAHKLSAALLRYLPSIWIVAFFCCLFLSGSCSATNSIAESLTYGSGVDLIHSATNSRLYIPGLSFRHGSGFNIASMIPADSFDGTASFYWSIRGGASDLKPVGEPVTCGDIIKLENIMTENFLMATPHETLLSSNSEVVLTSQAEKSADFVIECLNKGNQYLSAGEKFKLKHVELGGYLQCDKTHKYDERVCTNCPIFGHYELYVTPKLKRSNDAAWKFGEGIIIHKEEHLDAGDNSKHNSEL